MDNFWAKFVYEIRILEKIRPNGEPIATPSICL